MENLAAPNDIKSWLECLCFVLGIVSLLLVIGKQLRGKEPSPPNEQLHATIDELRRRVAHLETENTKVWVKMEIDARESLEKVGLLNARIEGIKAALDAANTALGLLSLKQINAK